MNVKIERIINQQRDKKIKFCGTKTTHNCHFYVIFIFDDFHKICKDFVILTFSIQFIKNILHIIIFCVSELFLLCHRQRLLSDLFFFVILEAMSIHTYNYLNNNDLWLSLHRFIDGFTGTVPLLSLELRMVIALSRRYSHPPRHRPATASSFPAFHVPIFLSLDTFRSFL